MKKIGDIFTGISSTISCAFDDIKEEQNAIINSDPIVAEWKSEKIQNDLKKAMENERPGCGAPGIQYPNYISWVEHTELKLLYVMNRKAKFHMLYRFSAERVVRDFGYVFLKILKDISPSIRALRISSPDDKMFCCERAVIYEEYM